MDTRLLREINRLFDELVHDPWRQMLPRATATRSASQSTSLLLDIPLKGSQVQCIALTTEAKRLTVTVSTASSQRLAENLEASRSAEQYQETFELPEGTTPNGFEARFEAGVLHLRVELRRSKG